MCGNCFQSWIIHDLSFLLKGGSLIDKLPQVFGTLSFRYYSAVLWLPLLKELRLTGIVILIYARWTSMLVFSDFCSPLRFSAWESRHRWQKGSVCCVTILLVVIADWFPFIPIGWKLTHSFLAIQTIHAFGCFTGLPFNSSLVALLVFLRATVELTFIVMASIMPM